MTPVSVADFRDAARRRLPAVLFDYIDGGAYAETTLAANVDDLARVRLRQRVLRDVSSPSLATRLFGEELDMPVVLSPVGMAGMYARRGEAQAARAATGAGIPFALSTMGVASIAEVAAAARPPWFQLYLVRDRGVIEALLATARGAGCPVLLLTVDLPLPSTRYRDARHAMIPTSPSGRLGQALDGLAHPAWLWDVWLRGRPHTLGSLAGAMGDLRGLGQYWGWIGRNFDPSVTWDDIAWIRDRWPGPLVLKGILDADDAREAARLGVDGIVVSNHGGRQLDGAPSSIAALPAVVDAVGDRVTVLMDGGVRSGLDVLKALAVGARGVLVGRAWAYALAAGGEAGVARLLALLRRELVVAMSLTGCLDVRAAGRDLLFPAP
ncbi:MAG: L-lactate dehydrogenase [Caulobacteraceae bacterium]|nr:L-lactate dehydrogenase [Caulobacteraceae bacterium]